MARKDGVQLRRDFATIDVEIEGVALRVSESALRATSKVGRELIEWLDSALGAYDHDQMT
jgi:hypothetical protein